MRGVDRKVGSMERGEVFIYGMARCLSNLLIGTSGEIGVQGNRRYEINRTRLGH